MVKMNHLLVAHCLAVFFVVGSWAQMSSSGSGDGFEVVVAGDGGDAVETGATSDEEAPPECGECDPKTCPPPPVCRAGYQSDACGCCSVCAASAGEQCDVDPSEYKYGACGDNLECKLRDDVKSSETESTCECTDNKLVCGTDGKTYENICELRGEGNMQLGNNEGNGTLTVSQWGPCEREPSISGKPEDARVEQGGNVALACEAKGWPVPVITWEAVRADGSQFILPSDHTTIAVQQRGGPERLMVSGWVQLMDVQPGDGGTYTCIAKNKLGEARLSAEVGVYKESDAQVGSNDNKV